MMFYSALLVLLITGVADIAEGSWPNGNPGVDRPGGDLPGMPIFLDGMVSSVAACYELCQSSPRCVAWSINSARCSEELIPACYLKAVVTKQALNSCAVRKKSVLLLVV